MESFKQRELIAAEAAPRVGKGGERPHLDCQMMRQWALRQQSWDRAVCQ